MPTKISLAESSRSKGLSAAEPSGLAVEVVLLKGEADKAGESKQVAGWHASSLFKELKKANFVVGL